MGVCVAGRGEAPGLTVIELARRLGRAESTVRYWRRMYRDLIPEAVGSDGYARYPLAVFAEIAAMHSRRLPPSEVRAALAERQPAEAPAPSRDDLILAELRAIRAAVERIADRLEPREGDG